MKKIYLVLGSKALTAKTIAYRYGVPADACILVNDQDHAKDLINNSKDLIVLSYDPTGKYNKHNLTK